MSYTLPLTAEELERRLLKISDLALSPVALDGTKIRVALEHFIEDGSGIKFKAPVNCSAVTTLVVQSPTGEEEFSFADANGNDIGVLDNLFSEGAIVNVLLDLDTKAAFVQNADTNQYLENRLAKIGTIAEGMTVADLIEAAKAAAETAQSEVDALELLVGTVPEGSDTVIAYVNKKAQDVLSAATGGSSESAASVKLALDNYKTENDAKVAANATTAATAQSKADEAYNLAATKADTDHDHDDKYDATGAAAAVQSNLDTHVVNHAPANAQANVIESIKVNGEAQAITNKAVNIAVPTGALANKSQVSEADLDSALTTKLSNLAESDHDHDDKYMSASFTESDPTVPDYVKAITTNDITNWNNKTTMAAVEAKNYLVAADIAGKVDSVDVYTKDEIDSKVAALGGEDDRLADLINSKAAQTALDAEVSARETAVSGLQTQINTIMNNPDTEGAINSINEFTTWVAEYGTIADGMRTDINKNKDDIAAEVKRAGEAESALSGRLGTLETNSATKTELQGVAADLSAYEAAHTNDYTNAQIDAAIPDALSDLSSDSTHRTVTDTEKATWNAKSDFSGDYNDLTNKPAIPSIAGLAAETYVDNAVSTKVDKVDGKGLSTNDYTTAEKNKLSGITDGAEVNQNAFSNIVVGSTTIAADSKTDSLTIAAGTGISVSGDAANDKVTITNSGVRSIGTGSANGTISVNTDGIAADVAVKGLGSAAYTASTAYDAAGTAQTKADAALASAQAYTDSATENVVYVSEENQESAVVPLNADTLQGLAATDFAPAGYGLGEQPHTASDINAELATGYFRTTSATENSPFNHGAAHVRKYNDSEVVQNLFRVTAGVEVVRYTTDGGATWTQEYVNPTMNLGTEYCTTERYTNKPVYAKLVNFGAFPATNNKNVAHATATNQVIISLHGQLSNGTPFSTGYNCDRTTNKKFWVDATKWNIRILTEADMSDLTAYVLVKYVKE